MANKPEEIPAILKSNDEILEARFPFLQDDVFLVAQVNARTGRQRLLLHQVDLKTRKIVRAESVDCIHVVVCVTTADELDTEFKHQELEDASLHIRSSEHLTKINLTPEERFVAFRSWVSGIAEAGMDAFRIQEEIDTAARLQIPVVTPILRFLAGVDISYIFQYLDYIEHAASYTGVRFDNFLIASLLPILEILKQSDQHTPEFSALLDQVFALAPPLTMFLEKEEYITFVHHPAALDLAREELVKLDRGTTILSDKKRAALLLILAEATLPALITNDDRITIEASLLKLAPPLKSFVEGQYWHFLLQNPIKYLLVEHELDRITTAPDLMVDPCSQITLMLEILIHDDARIPAIDTILDKIFRLHPPLSVFLAREDFFPFLLKPSARPVIERDIATTGWYPELSSESATTRLLYDIGNGKKFRGRLLFPVEYAFLTELEQALTPNDVPASNFSEETIEFTSRNGHITRLIIFNHNRTITLNFEAILNRVDHLVRLEEFDLRRCSLHVLPPTMANLKKLRILRLIENNLTILPEFIGNWTILEELTLIGNQISLLPEKIQELKSLRSLDLSANKLEVLPDGIGNLLSLKELVINYNCLKSLPSSLGNLRALEKLHLRNNCLESLPETIGNSTSLKELILYGNNLSTLPLSLRMLERLKTLNLGKNRFISIPDVIYDLKSLAMLIMADNVLDSVPEIVGELTHNASSHIWVSKMIRNP